MKKPTPKYKAEDKVLYMAEFDGKKTQVVAKVISTSFSYPHWAWCYYIEYQTTFGWATENVLEMYLTPLHKACKSITLKDFAIEIAANNPGFNCKIDTCHEFSWNTAVIFECQKTVPPLCKKIVIRHDDLENFDISEIIDALKEDFEVFRKECERKYAATKIDYIQFVNCGARSGGKTECLKEVLNSFYGADNMYKGGFVYQSKSNEDSQSKKLAELAPYAAKGLTDGINSESDKDFWDAFRYTAFTKPYTNAIVKYNENDVKRMIEVFDEFVNGRKKEESGMNVTKVNKKQEVELMEYYQNVPWPYRPKKIIFNGPATIVIWEDDTKTVVKCGKNEEDDRKLAFKYVIHKKYVELHHNENNYLRQFTKALEKTGDPQAAFVEVFSKMEMHIATDGKSDEYFKAIEKHFQKEFES